jgi:hypothetical protein
LVLLDKLEAYGHAKIKCLHNTTIEVTKDDYLTEAGTCILGINASKSCYDLAPLLKSSIKKGDKITVLLVVDELYDFFEGYGNSQLTLTNPHDMVFRKSDFICDRTVLINCNKSSSDLDRELINRLKNEKKFTIKFLK